MSAFGELYSAGAGQILQNTGRRQSVLLRHKESKYEFWPRRESEMEGKIVNPSLPDFLSRKNGGEAGVTDALGPPKPRLGGQMHQETVYVKGECPVPQSVTREGMSKTVQEQHSADDPDLQEGGGVLQAQFSAKISSILELLQRSGAPAHPDQEQMHP